MEEKKLTDDEIVKAYKYCVLDDGNCDYCPYAACGCGIDGNDIIDIIHRQKAEIERLKERNYWLQSEHEYQCEKSYFEGVEKGEKKSAKEILQELYDQIDENTPKWVGVQIKIIAKRKGVEVE